MLLRSAFIMVVAATAGCVNLPNGYRSTRFTTSIHKIDRPYVQAVVQFRLVRIDPPAALHVAHSPKGHYQLHLGRSRMVYDHHDPAFRECQEHHAEILLKQIDQTGRERYPGLFSSSDEALPVCVRITEAKRKDHVESWQRNVGVLQLLSLVLPLPTELQWSIFEVKPGIVEENGVRWSEPIPVKRADYGWYSSVNPLALMPFPGRSDWPRVLETDPWGSPTRTIAGGKLTIESFVDAIVESLANVRVDRDSGGSG